MCVCEREREREWQIARETGYASVSLIPYLPDFGVHVYLFWVERYMYMCTTEFAGLKCLSLGGVPSKWWSLLR